MDDTQNLFQVARWQRVFKSVVPCRCKICQTINPELICQHCLSKLSRPVNACDCCGTLLKDTNKLNSQSTRLLCGHCMTRPLPYQATRFPYIYCSPLAELIQNFKYNQDLILSAWFGHAMASALTLNQQTNSLPDFLIPVPLHISRLKQRGFNQSYLLARHIGKQLDIPVLKQALTRQRATPKQSGLNQRERQQNLLGAFKLDLRPADSTDKLKGKHIVIVDDVITTGSTMHEVAKVLSRAKPGRITLLAIAKTGSQQAYSDPTLCAPAAVPHGLL